MTQKEEWPSVAIGMPCRPLMPIQTVNSLARTVKACAERGVKMEVIYVAGSSIVTSARDRVVHEFLKSDSQLLFWIDDDIKWFPDDFLSLVALASKVGVVGGAYPGKKEPARLWVNRTGKDFEMNEYGLLQVAGLGLGFCCMTREVVEAVAKDKDTLIHEDFREEMKSVFRLDSKNGRFRGEDMAFFADIKSAGYKVWLDPRVQLGHVGSKVYSADPIEALNLGHIYKLEAV